MNSSDQDPVYRAPSATSAQSFSKIWTKWASGLFKREKPLGSEPWFNPEAVTEQKREWLEQQKSVEAKTAATWPEHIYESFYVLGLSPDMEVTHVAEQLCELERKQRHHNDADTDSDHGKERVQPPQPAFPPQVLFRYPASSSAPISDSEVAALAFPSGVAPEKLKRTPSLSALDDTIMGRDSEAQQQCFVFMIKVAGNFPLYGCCWYVREMLHRAPYLARSRYRSCRAPFRSCMIAAPRCYCLLSRYPFFELHFRVLKIVLDLERLERLLEYDWEKAQMPPASLDVCGAPGATRTGRHSTPSPEASLPPASGSSSSSSKHSTAALETNYGSQSSAGTYDQLSMVVPPVGRTAQPAKAAQQSLQQQAMPMVHNRQAYCTECAGIIEDMCPFTPGPDLQQPQRRSSSCISAAASQPLQQPQLSNCAVGLRDPGYCEVCGKPLGVSVLPGSDAAVSGTADSTAAACSNAAPSAAVQPVAPNAIGLPAGSKVAETAGVVLETAGPLEANILSLQLQQQQSAATGFAASKAWVAAAGKDLSAIPGAEQAQQVAQFDAIAAAVSGFDSVAASAAKGSSSSSGGSYVAGGVASSRSNSTAIASAAGGGVDERWVNWQNVVSAIRGVVSVPLPVTREMSQEGVGDDVIGSATSEPVAQQETSMVQRMWDAWAPRTSAAADASIRSSGALANFLPSRRSSKTSITSVTPQPDQQQQVLSVQHPQQQMQPQQVQQDANLSHMEPQALQQQDGSKQPVHQEAQQDDLQQSITAANDSSPRIAAALQQHLADNNSHALDRRGDAALVTSTSQSHQQPATEAVNASWSRHGHTLSASSFHSALDAVKPELPSAAAAGFDDEVAAAASEPDVESVYLSDTSLAQQQVELSSPVRSLAYQQRNPAGQNVEAERSAFMEQQQQQQAEAGSPDIITGSSETKGGPTSPFAVAAVGNAASQLPGRHKLQPEPMGSSMCNAVPAGWLPAQQQHLRRSSSAGAATMQSAAAASALEFGSNSAYQAAQSCERLIRSSSCGVTEGLVWTAVACSSRRGSAGEVCALRDVDGSHRDVTIAGDVSASMKGACEGLQVQQQMGSPRVSIMPATRKSNRDLFEDVTQHRSGELSADLCKTISHLVQADSTSLLAAYRNSPVPLPGEMYRLTLGDLYRLEFDRMLPLQQYMPPGRSKLQHDVLSYAEVECAQQLQLWTVAALCRSLSLENIITLLNAALLEKQLVVFCPHIGTLAAIVLALVPLLRPFAWHSLMLPVTPDSMLGFLDAPVPFVLGVQYKTPAVASRCHGLLRVNVYKNAIKNASFPAVPNSRQLAAALTPYHAALREAAELAVERPVHVITPDEELAAHKFLAVVHEHLSKMCGDLRLHTIVNVGMSKRTGVFMKESLIDSVPAKDKLFMRAFIETQMFTAYADGGISDYCES